MDLAERIQDEPLITTLAQAGNPRYACCDFFLSDCDIGLYHKELQIDPHCLGRAANCAS